ncbi:hypothetical protein FOA52_009039 [Chlamydomonas sp. UWO 241]|nr:hypothetical protein FOA52_009039 [Chlamydomonas sp. UWO 241]
MEALHLHRSQVDDDPRWGVGAVPRLRQTMTETQQQLIHQMVNPVVKGTLGPGTLHAPQATKFTYPTGANREGTITVHPEVLKVLVSTSDTLNMAHAQFEYHKQELRKQPGNAGLDNADLEKLVIADMESHNLPEGVPEHLLREAEQMGASIGAQRPRSRGWRGSAAAHVSAGIPQVLAKRRPTSLWGHFDALEQLAPPEGTPLSPLPSPMSLRPLAPDMPGPRSVAFAKVWSKGVEKPLSASWSDLLRLRKRSGHAAKLRALRRSSSSRARAFERNHAAKTIQRAWRACAAALAAAREAQRAEAERLRDEAERFSRADISNTKVLCELSRQRAMEQALRASASTAWQSMLQDCPLSRSSSERSSGGGVGSTSHRERATRAQNAFYMRGTSLSKSRKMRARIAAARARLAVGAPKGPSAGSDPQGPAQHAAQGCPWPGSGPGAPGGERAPRASNSACVPKRAFAARAPRVSSSASVPLATLTTAPSGSGSEGGAVAVTASAASATAAGQQGACPQASTHPASGKWGAPDPGGGRPFTRPATAAAAGRKQGPPMSPARAARQARQASNDAAVAASHQSARKGTWGTPSTSRPATAPSPPPPPSPTRRGPGGARGGCSASAAPAAPAADVICMPHWDAAAAADRAAMLMRARMSASELLQKMDYGLGALEATAAAAAAAEAADKAHAASERHVQVQSYLLEVRERRAAAVVHALAGCDGSVGTDVDAAGLQAVMEQVEVSTAEVVVEEEEEEEEGRQKEVGQQQREGWGGQLVGSLPGMQEVDEEWEEVSDSGVDSLSPEERAALAAAAAAAAASDEWVRPQARGDGTVSAEVSRAERAWEALLDTAQALPPQAFFHALAAAQDEAARIGLDARAQGEVLASLARELLPGRGAADGVLSRRGSGSDANGRDDADVLAIMASFYEWAERGDGDDDDDDDHGAVSPADTDLFAATALAATVAAVRHASIRRTAASAPDTNTGSTTAPVAAAAGAVCGSSSDGLLDEAAVTPAAADVGSGERAGRLLEAALTALQARLRARLKRSFCRAPAGALATPDAFALGVLPRGPHRRLMRGLSPALQLLLDAVATNPGLWGRWLGGWSLALGCPSDTHQGKQRLASASDTWRERYHRMARGRAGLEEGEKEGSNRVAATQQQRQWQQQQHQWRATSMRVGGASLAATRKTGGPVHGRGRIGIGGGASRHRPAADHQLARRQRAAATSTTEEARLAEANMAGGGQQTGDGMWSAGRGAAAAAALRRQAPPLQQQQQQEEGVMAAVRAEGGTVAVAGAPAPAAPLLLSPQPPASPPASPHARRSPHQTSAGGSAAAPRRSRPTTAPSPTASLLSQSCPPPGPMSALGCLSVARVGTPGAAPRGRRPSCELGAPPPLLAERAHSPEGPLDFLMSLSDSPRSSVHTTPGSARTSARAHTATATPPGSPTTAPSGGHAPRLSSGTSDACVPPTSPNKMSLMRRLSAPGPTVATAGPPTAMARLHAQSVSPYLSFQGLGLPVPSPQSPTRGSSAVTRRGSGGGTAMARSTDSSTPAKVLAPLPEQ